MNITAKIVNMTDGSQKIRLETPFHPDLPTKLRKLGGQWDSNKRVWYMPSDLQKEISAACLAIFSVDPFAEQSADLVDVRVDISLLSCLVETLWMLGRPVLRRPGRDADVRPGEGVSIISGGFGRSGGSRNNPRVGFPEDNTVLLIRDVPRTALTQLAKDYPDLTPEIIEKVRQ